MGLVWLVSRRAVVCTATSVPAGTTTMTDEQSYDLVEGVNMATIPPETMCGSLDRRFGEDYG